MSVIGEGAFAKLTKLGYKAMASPVSFVRVADGSKHSVSGVVLLPILMGNITHELSFLVVPALRDTVVLGIDFWIRFKIVLGVKGTELYLNQASDTLGDLGNHGVYSITDERAMNAEQRGELGKIIHLYKGLDKKLGRTHLTSHHIDTADAPPVKQRHYPLSPAMLKKVNVVLDQMLADDVVEPSESPWSSPTVIVSKASGEIRLCFDGRAVNKVTKKDAYPLPFISRILDKLRDAKYISSIDLRSAFWQIPLTESSKEKTAFTVPGRGLFQYKVMPFGLCNAPQTLQRLMDRLFGPEFDDSIFAYLDDIVIVNRDFESHLECLRKVLEKLQMANLSINLEKCQFCRPELEYLGYIVDQFGLRTDPKKVEAIMQYPQPRTTTELRRFLGLASWYRRFIDRFSDLTAPLTALIAGTQRKKRASIGWNSEAQKAFEELKLRLCRTPVLRCPDFDLGFTIQCDASNVGLAAVLTQNTGTEEYVVAYASRTLTNAERKFSATEKECLAVLFGIEKYRSYIEGTKFQVLTDHFSLLWLHKLKDPTGRLGRWAVRLQQFDFDLIHRKGQENIVPDSLSRAPVELSTVEIDISDPDPWYCRMVRKVLAKPQQFPEWRVADQKLYRFIENQTVGDERCQWKLVVPQKNRADVLRECHDDATAAHLGIFKTTHRVCLKYYWPKMAKDIKSYVLKCETCLAYKSRQFKQLGLMGNFCSVDRPFQMIATDLLGPYPRSSKGYKFVLVVVDWLTKFTLTFPLRSATAPAVARHLENDVFLTYGVPGIIVCDNGPQYVSRALKDLKTKYEIPKIWYTARYHPQPNFSERVNKTIVTAIATYLKEKHTSWDEELPRITCAIRTAVHEITRHSPYFLNFGREMVISGKDYGKPPANTDCVKEATGAQFLRHKTTVLNKVYIDVVERLKKAYQKNKKNYDLRRRQCEFFVGDIVWKRNIMLSDAAKNTAAKFFPKFIKCEVTEKKSPLIYRLKNLLTGKDVGYYHVKDFKSRPQQ